MTNAITPKEGEEVLMYLHKSIFVMRKQMLVFAASVIVSVLLLTFLYKYSAAGIVSALILLASLVYVFYYFIIWFYDVYIVTNIRVIINSKSRLFGHDYTEFGYKDVADVSYRVQGVFGTLFQYGDVLVTLKDGPEKLLVNLSTPGVVQETLKNLVDVTNNKKYH